MTEQEFLSKHNEILRIVPKEFVGYLSQMAWDRGHSAGYAEVISNLTELVDGFMISFREYEKNFAHYFDKG